MNILKEPLHKYLVTLSVKFNISMDILEKEFNIRQYKYKVKHCNTKYSIYIDKNYNKYILLNNSQAILIT